MGRLRRARASTAARACSTRRADLGVGQAQVARAEGHVLLDRGGEKLIGRVLKDHADRCDTTRRGPWPTGRFPPGGRVPVADGPAAGAPSSASSCRHRWPPSRPPTRRARRGRSSRPGPRSRRDRRNGSLRLRWPWGGSRCSQGPPFCQHEGQRRSAPRRPPQTAASRRASGGKSGTRQRALVAAGDHRLVGPLGLVDRAQHHDAGQAAQRLERAAVAWRARAALLRREHAGGLLEEA